MRYCLILPAIFTCLFNAEARSIPVGLYHDRVISSVVISCSTGTYHIESGDEIIGTMEEGELLFVRLENDSLVLHDSDREYGSFMEIRLNYMALGSSFRIRPIEPALESRTYDDNLILRGGDRFITLVNLVDFDKYLAGVVEAEAGPNAEPEFYKAQSVLCRTYAVKYLDRHETEGYALCDGVHCQAYRGKSIYNPAILEAVVETTGEVPVSYTHLTLPTKRIV